MVEDAIDGCPVYPIRLLLHQTFQAMNELQQLIDLSDQWIKETCERKQDVSRKRKQCANMWIRNMAIAALLEAFLVAVMILTQAWALLIPSAAFIF